VTSSRIVRALLPALILIAALAIRVAYVESTPYRLINDGYIYNRQASMMATNGDYDTDHRPGTGALGSRGPIAYFPPAFPYVLAVSDLLTGHESGGRPAVEPERIEQALLGTAAVALLGLVALEAFGATVAVVAMVLAAVYPVFVEMSGILAAENLLVVLELAMAWTALRARRSGRPLRWIAATGVLTGLATLTHQNAILLLLPLGAAAVAAVRGPSRARAGSAITLLVMTTLVVILPWTIRNAIVLHRFLPVSDETGITLVGAYNPASAAFRPVPYKWRIYAQIPEDRALAKHVSRYSEADLSDRLQTQALDYISAHPLSPFAVAAHNTLRMFELEGTYAWHASATAMGLSIGTAHTGIVAFWILCLLALAGVFTRAARGAPRWLWAIPVLLALSVVVINVETPRFREPVDPFLVLLAACAVSRVPKRLGVGEGRTPGASAA
jgi:4-amino-4-deoxy-L-arabinose transferase-like glycosyltransferase